MYQGFTVSCGCHCVNCGNSVKLEGYADASGNHYCPTCNNYVGTTSKPCSGRTPQKVRKRQKAIEQAKQNGEYEE